MGIKTFCGTSKGLQSAFCLWPMTCCRHVPIRCTSPVFKSWIAPSFYATMQILYVMSVDLLENGQIFEIINLKGTAVTMQQTWYVMDFSRNIWSNKKILINSAVKLNTAQVKSWQNTVWSGTCRLHSGYVEASLTSPSAYSSTHLGYREAGSAVCLGNLWLDPRPCLSWRARDTPLQVR